MAPLRYAAKFDSFLSLDCALQPGAIQVKEGIKFCHLATLSRDEVSAALFVYGDRYVQDVPSGHSFMAKMVVVQKYRVAYQAVLQVLLTLKHKLLLSIRIIYVLKLNFCLDVN